MEYTEPFQEDTLISPFLKVDDYRYLRFAVISDRSLRVYAEWSHDGAEVVTTSQYLVSANEWISESHMDVKLDYVRFRFIKGAGIVQTHFAFRLSGPRWSSNPVAGPKPALSASSFKEAEERSRSPFQKLLGKERKVKIQEKIELTDYRLPGLILKGTMLYAEGNNRLGVISPGAPGELLYWGPHGPEWVHFDEIKNLLL